MSIRVNINGVISPPENALVSALDHGFLFGDSVYETLRTYGGKPFLFSRHYSRLEHSARGVAMNLKWNKDRTLDEVRRTVLQAANPETRVRVTVSRGVGDLSLDPETCADPTVVIIASPLAELPATVFTNGVGVVTSSVQRVGQFGSLKTGSLISQVVAYRESTMKNAFEAILLTPDGYLSDGITSNIYLIRAGKLLAPSLKAGILEGITRGVVLDLAREIGVEVVQGLFRPDEIQRADEMFLTSSTRGVVPIATVDGRPISTLTPGPLTTKLMDAYNGAVTRLISED
jgi:branched-chain amino acid aminotransferase